MLVAFNAFYITLLFGLYLPARPFCGNADFDADEEEEGEPEETAPPEEWSGITRLFIWKLLYYIFMDDCITAI